MGIGTRAEVGIGTGVEARRRDRARVGRAARWIVGPLLALAVAGVVAVAARSERPRAAGDGVSLVAVSGLGAVLGLLFVALLLAAALALGRRVPPVSDRPGRRIGTLGIVVLVVVLLVATRLAGGDRPAPVDVEPPGVASEGEPDADRDPLTSSPTALAAGLLAMLLVATAVSLRFRPGPRRSPAGSEAAVTDDLPVAVTASDLDPRGDPHDVVLTAYAAGRALVQPLVEGSPSLGPLALLARCRRLRGGEAFEALTWTYLPVRFGLVGADEAARARALDQLAQLRRELDTGPGR